MASAGVLDLNSQVQAAEGFPHMQEYGAYLRGDDDAALGRRHVSGPHPPRAPRSLGVPNQRAGRGAGLAARGPLSARQLNFGASSSAAGGRGGQDDVVSSWPAHSGGNSGLFIGGSSSGAGGGGRERANSSSRAPGRRRPRSNASNRGGARGRGGRGGRVARSAGPPQAPGGGYTDVDDEGAWEEEVEDYGSSGVPPEEEGYEQMDQREDDGGSTSSSEDEIIFMCRKNLKMAQNFVAQMVPIFGMYSDNYFVKLPRRQDGESGLQWV